MAYYKSKEREKARFDAVHDFRYSIGIAYYFFTPYGYKFETVYSDGVRIREEYKNTMVAWPINEPWKLNMSGYADLESAGITDVQIGGYNWEQSTTSEFGYRSYYLSFYGTGLYPSTYVFRLRGHSVR